MTPYWLLFIFPALTTLFPMKGSVQSRTALFSIYALFAILLIGLRYEVGGDWQNYLVHLDSTDGVGLAEAITLHDPGYMAVNWLSTQLDLGIAGVNLICAALFTIGLLRFCLKQPLPWLGLAIATPYLLVVVAMGYTRQSVALGFIFWALSEWKPGNFVRYGLLIFIAALFHKSAVLIFPLMLLIGRQGLWLKLLIAIPVFIVVALLLWMDSFESQWTNYVEKEMQSEGGLIRVTMNMVPALLLLFFYKRFQLFSDFKLWLAIAAASLLFFFLEPLASTAVDRFALYLSPIQVAVFSRLPILIVDPSLRALTVVIVLLFYASALWTWLNFSSHSEYWLPYHWILFK